MKTLLSTSAVALLAFATLSTAAQAAIVLDYDFEEGSGLTIADAASPAQNGTMRNGSNAATGANGPQFVPGLDGSGYALSFDGASGTGADNVLIGTNLDLLNGAPGGTVAAYIKVDSFGTSTSSAAFENIFFATKDTYNTARLALSVGNAANGGSTSSGQLRMGARSADTDGFLSLSSTGIFLNNTDTYFVAGVSNFAADTITLYVQNMTLGTPMQMVSGTVNFSANAAANTNSTIVVLGSRYTSATGIDEVFHGKVDRLRVYNEPLSQAQVEGLVIPEPASAFLALAGWGLLGLRRRR